MPLSYLLAAAPALSSAGADAPRWRWARCGSTLAVGAALLSLLWLVVGDGGLVRGPGLVTLGDAGALHVSVRSDALGGLMLLLVAASSAGSSFATRSLTSTASAARRATCAA